MNRLSIRNILVPTDFSKISIGVIEPATWLAGRFAASIHLVHVHRPAYPAGFVAAASPSSVMTYEQEAKERVADELNALAQKYGSPRRDVMSYTALRLQRNLWAGRRNSRRPHCHAHAWTNWLRANVPRQHRRTNRAALAVSGVYHAAAGQRPVRKEGWLQKDSCAGRFLRLLSRRTPIRDEFAECFGAKVIVLHVISLPYPYITLDGMYQRLTRDIRKDAARQMQRFLETIELRDVKVQTVITKGTPSRRFAHSRQIKSQSHHYINART